VFDESQEPVLSGPILASSWYVTGMAPQWTFLPLRDVSPGATQPAHLAGRGACTADEPGSSGPA
jgi:hypothetical protein